MSSYRQHFIKKYKSDLTIQDLEFLKWIDKVESIIQSQFRLNLLDLSDMPYYISFEDGMTIEEMVEEIIKN